MLSFYRSEDQYMNHWAKIKVSAGIPFWKLKKRLHFLVFSASRGLPLVLAHGPLYFKNSSGEVSDPSHAAIFLWQYLAKIYFVNRVDPPVLTQNNLPISRSLILITFAVSLLPCQVT